MSVLGRAFTIQKIPTFSVSVNCFFGLATCLMSSILLLLKNSQPYAEITDYISVSHMSNEISGNSLKRSGILVTKCSCCCE